MKAPAARAPTLWRKMPSRMACVDALCLEIRALLQTNDLCEAGFAVELLAREVLNNAVIHGNRNDAAKAIMLRIWVGREWIRLQVGDEGCGFAWRKARPNGLNTTACSGRGLQLCALYAGRVRFNRRGNQITLWIKKLWIKKKTQPKRKTANG